MHNFKELEIWKRSRILVKDIYLLISNFPRDEKFGLISQMKRAVVSIPSNIAEGSGRSSDKEFVRFLDIAIGSAFELETQLYLALDLSFISNKELNNILFKITEIEKMIHGFKKKLMTQSKI